MSIGPRGKRPQRRIVLLLLFALSSCAQRQDGGDLDYHRGRNAMAMARYDWARFYFTADLQANPKRLDSLRGLGLGWISGYQGSLSHGVEALEKYLELAPEDPEIRLRLARSWLQAGERERALGALEGLEDSLEKQLLITRVHLAEDPETARSQILAALEGAPDHFAVRHLAAQVYARLGEDAEALTQARRAAQIECMSAELFYLTAQILRRQGNLLESAEALATYGLLRQLPGPGSALDARKELALLRQLEDRLSPSSSAFKKRLGRLLLETGRMAQATPLLEEILHHPDGDLESLLLLAQAAHTQGRTVVARDLYQGVLDRASVEQEATYQKALAQQALLAYETQDFETAQGLLNRGLELDPHYAPLHFTTGLLALAQGEEERAVQAFATAIDLVPWLGRYRLTLADVFLTRGDRAAVDRLLAQTPAPDPTIDAYKKKHEL